MAAKKSEAKTPEASKRGPKGPMSNAHKDALAQGRTEGRAVRDYLEALRSARPRRGRKRTAESIQKRLDTIDDLLTDADPLTELKLVQERRQLTTELNQPNSSIDIAVLENSFVDVAKSFSQRQGISYASWREVGVAAGVLKRAGIDRA